MGSLNETNKKSADFVNKGKGQPTTSKHIFDCKVLVYDELTCKK